MAKGGIGKLKRKEGFRPLSRSLERGLQKIMVTRIVRIGRIYTDKE
jgi:hypothetical protein